MTDILRALLDSCERTPTAPALTLRRTTLRYADLRDRVLGVASSLSERGLVPGDRVLFSVRPGLDGIVLALGIIAAGGTVVFADPGAGDTLFRARAQLAAPRWIAAESLLYAVSSGPLRGIARRRGIDLPDYAAIVPDARHLYSGPWLPGVPKSAVALRRLFRGSPGVVVADPHAEALVIFTSGTTDAPKAVVHSRTSLGTGLDDFAQAVGFVAGERVLTDQLMVGIPALIAGAHWELPPPGLDPGARPERYLGLLPRADVLFAVPAALDALLHLLESRPELTPHLRALVIGGAPVLRPLLERGRKQLPGTAIRCIYGMTEILPVAIADGDEKLEYTGAGDFVGTLASSVSASIRDGELVVSGPGLADYLDEPLDELATGDLARLEGERLVLAGRSKEMFIRGTTNVYPGLYEPVIAGLPGVRAAALVGIPNQIGDDELVLAVVLDGATVDAVRTALPGLIDAAVLPDRIVELDELPTAGRSAKLDRDALAEALR
ncbi:acyl-CoA synthetase (AMP-forming)/AMP-acid ligase II [Microbacteriaceae bacterium SG_E_30_P1]|uniref:Acyl-CoA synthetase (AMP-forming)/AMP-acid ligase II n=1 Tax=Antiquaquibacter oligotrophicus TaxID=2880260 RepID=A0ABT6KK02_9MICO|nr:class I adenylate-forming enzyme family protein [Antiquaquibacter oligotrophicus]MDH6180271.1 acyl-CoA synthetase (AMP-forming)/AMP-acid ligase II [Antiquaquibacter oligotrophicus]UDF13982.1 acyl--CoA ligase [Antiquaquibacter oligotrophicus]